MMDSWDKFNLIQALQNVFTLPHYVDLKSE